MQKCVDAKTELFHPDAMVIIYHCLQVTNNKEEEKKDKEKEPEEAMDAEV